MKVLWLPEQRKIAHLKKPEIGYQITTAVASGVVMFLGVYISISIFPVLPFTAIVTFSGFLLAILIYLRECAKTGSFRDSAANTIMLGTFIYIGILGILMDGIGQIELLLYGTPYQPSFQSEDIFWSMIFNFFAMFLSVLAFLRIKGRKISSIGFVSKNLGYNMILGTASGIILFFILVFSLLVMIELGFQIPENRSAEGFSTIGIPMILLISGGAALTEETFFRGFLQNRIGLFWASMLFGLAHIGYGNTLQIVFPFVYGLVFGWLYKKTNSLAAPMTAHFVYDLIVLGISQI